MKNILIVDDEKNYLLVLETLLSDEGYCVKTCQDPKKAAALALELNPQLIISDLKMPGFTGIELLKEVRKNKGQMPFIIMTAFGTIETAVEAMSQGAFHYILKPFSNKELILIVKRALEMNALLSEKGRLTRELSKKLGFEDSVFASPEIKKIRNLALQVAPTRSTVLIEGESGTGKELIARTIHKASDRSGKPFITVNCGALSETLLESELFGHEKGAFTGAIARKIGLFEAADKGTIFLDEISTTSEAMQIKLLRVLQEQSFERVGGVTSVKVDIRVIAATNKGLKRLVKEGLFREDLFYRLNVIEIEIPPLRKRPADITPLAEHFVKLLSAETGMEVDSISDDASKLLCAYSWPGNVRELRNIIERAVVLSNGRIINKDDLPAELQTTTQTTSTPEDSTIQGKTLPEAVDNFERQLIVKALKNSAGIRAKAAKTLGISPTNLQYKLGKYKL